MQLNLGQVKGEDGASVYIKYNTSPSDVNATDFWSSEQQYIGVQTSKEKSKPATGYTWTKFVGENGTDGKNCYIKYNTTASDIDATKIWTFGQNYIGFMVSNAVTAPINGYTWSKFIHNPYPVGSIYISIMATSPENLFGGSWTRITNDAYLKIVTADAGIVGGTSSSHKIPVESMPNHNHSLSPIGFGSGINGAEGTTGWLPVSASGVTDNTGGGNAYYPYYYGVYAWFRSA